MSIQEFNAFHNEVFNLPRDSFSNFNTLKVKSLAEYLISVKDRFPSDGLALTDIYLAIHQFLLADNIDHPNADFRSLFNLNLHDAGAVRQHYSNVAGRLFRHWMELAGLLELLANYHHGNKRSKRLLTTFTDEMNDANTGLIDPLIRDKVLSINTLSNPALGNLDTHYLYRNLDYRPAWAILSYIREMDRPCTKFELSIFFGRPDYHLDTEGEIVEAAVNTGALFPRTQDQQIDYYFRQRGWVHPSGALYAYVASQQPYFKFNAFFVLMQAAGLIDYDGRTNTCRLTDFSRGLFAAAAGPEAKELETLLDEVETATEDTDLAEKVARNRALLIEKLLAEDGAFLDAANQRAAAKSGTNTTVSQTTRWRRDQLIREVSKQKANYACQGCGRLTFIDKSGNNFVESHHIIEYNSTEEGPDVLQNLLVLCPNCHSKIHFARLDVIDEFYQDLRHRRVITIEQFIEIHERLTLLKLSHVVILRNKGIITQTEFDELAALLPNP